MDLPKFLENIDVRSSNDCWNWLRGIEGHGYGMAWHNGRQIKAHRLSWLLHYGLLPKWDGYDGGLCILHACDNPRCCNPRHLFIGTHAENMRDRDHKGRTARQQGETHGGSKLTERQVKAIRNDIESGRSIAKKYGVSEAIVSMIKSRKVWSHL